MSQTYEVSLFIPKRFINDQLEFALMREFMLDKKEFRKVMGAAQDGVVELYTDHADFDDIETLESNLVFVGIPFDRMMNMYPEEWRIYRPATSRKPKIDILISQLQPDDLSARSITISEREFSKLAKLPAILVKDAIVKKFEEFNVRKKNPLRGWAKRKISLQQEPIFVDAR